MGVADIAFAYIHLKNSKNGGIALCRQIRLAISGKLKRELDICHSKERCTIYG